MNARKHTMKILPLTAAALAGGLIATALAGKGGDWRKTASLEEKVDKLVEVMPGAAVIMHEVGDRYRNLYWAGKQGQWEFAEYQAEEIKDLIEMLQITRPARAATAQTFLDRSYPHIEAAARSRDWQRFQSAFADLRRACMDCHVQNDYAFIRLPAEPRAPTSIVLEAE